MNKQIKFGIVLQYAQMFVSILISLIYTPVMLKILGQSEYGLYNLASSIISYLSLLSLGFGSSYIRFYSRYKVKDDTEGIKKLNGLYLIVFSFMGMISLIAGLVLSNNVSLFFNETYSSNDLYIAKILMIFLSINLAISFPASVFVSYITSQEKFIFQKLVNIGKTILSPVLSVVFLILGYGSIGMVVVTTCISLVVDMTNLVYCFKKIGMKISFKNLNYSLLKEIAVFSIFIALNQVIDQINWQTDKIILGKMISGSAVAIYAVASTINNLYISFSTSISSVFAPKINKIVSENNDDCDERLTDLFIKVGRIQFYIVILILMVFLFFGETFVIKWAGTDYVESYYVAMILMAPMIVPLIQNIGIEVRRAKNKHKIITFFSLFTAVLNVVISFLLINSLGVMGVAIGTGISVLLNSFIMNIYYHFYIKLNIVRFWTEILKLTPLVLVSVIIGFAFNLIFGQNNIIIYGLVMFLYVVLYFFNVIIVMNKEEKMYIKGLLKKGGKNHEKVNNQ